MATVIQGPVGANPADAASTKPGFTLGSRIRMSDGTEWVYLAVAASTTTIRQYDMVGATATNVVAGLTSTVAGKGVLIAIAQAAVTLDASNIQYMWFLVANPFASTSYKVRVLASAAIDAKLATTASIGSLDDTTAGTTYRVDVITLTDSQPSGSSGSRTFRTGVNPIQLGGTLAV